MAGPSDAYSRFIASMTIGFDQGHDGEGYDLEALAALSGAESKSAETLLIARAGHGWRDAAALAALGTPAAIAVLQHQLTHGHTLLARLDAAAALLGREPPPDASTVLSEAVQSPADFSMFSRAMDLIGWHKALGTLPALLSVARSGPGDHAVHAAAMICYLRGITDEPFDWSMRPFFLRFGEDQAIREAAFTELAGMTAE